MARKKRCSGFSSTPISIGNCEVVVESGKFSSELNENSLNITLSKNSKIKISVVDDGNCSKEAKSPINIGYEENGNYCFVLINPKDDDGKTKSLLQVILSFLSLYFKDNFLLVSVNTQVSTEFCQEMVSGILS
ncbi:uncharacterized protein LOC132044257, partial [Lycium ferocissimum]|uniref:uncharacterized protein LOC132044257 n=1 Tax=Lycium ferocissimum TaxID=112874 RepID=UPI0028167594